MKKAKSFRLFLSDITDPIFEAINNAPPLLLKLLKKKASAIKAEEIRKERNSLMTKSDIAVNKAADQGNTEAEARARTYRQALRDIPEQEGFPFEVEWPEL